MSIFRLYTAKKTSEFNKDNWYVRHDTYDACIDDVSEAFSLGFYHATESEFQVADINALDCRSHKIEHGDIILNVGTEELYILEGSSATFHHLPKAGLLFSK